MLAVKEGVFSEEIIDYSLEMAESLSYEIVALSMAPLTCDTFRMFPDAHDQMCQNFREISQKNVEYFKAKAANGKSRKQR